MSFSLLVCYFPTEIRQIWGYLHFWMRYLSEIFLGHSWDIGSQVFTLLGWADILTFEFLCAGLDCEISDLVTFWLFDGQLLRPSSLVSFEFDGILFSVITILWKVNILENISSEGSHDSHYLYGEKGRGTHRGSGYILI